MDLLSVCLLFLTNFPNLLLFFFADTLLRKAFNSPSFEGYNFVSSLLVLLGLIKVCWIWICSNRGTHLSVFDFDTFFPSCGLLFFPILLTSQSEEKVKPVHVVPGHLQALEHIVRQDYFPKESVTVLQAFMSR